MMSSSSGAVLLMTMPMRPTEEGRAPAFYHSMLLHVLHRDRRWLVGSFRRGARFRGIPAEAPRARPRAIPVPVIDDAAPSTEKCNSLRSPLLACILPITHASRPRRFDLRSSWRDRQHTGTSDADRRAKSRAKKTEGRSGLARFAHFRSFRAVSIRSGFARSSYRKRAKAGQPGPATSGRLKDEETPHRAPTRPTIATNSSHQMYQLPLGHPAQTPLGLSQHLFIVSPWHCLENCFGRLSRDDLPATRALAPQRIQKAANPTSPESRDWNEPRRGRRQWFCPA